MNEIANLPSGYLGISMGAKYLTTEHFGDYCAWSKINFNRFAFLLGDYIHTFTLQGLAETTVRDAELKCRMMSEQLEKFIDRVAAAYNIDYEIVSWYDLKELAPYKERLALIESEFEQSAAFRKAVKSQVVQNLGQRALDVGFSVDAPETRITRTLSTYVLHEIAGLITMSEDVGYHVEVYPGEDLRVLVDIYGGVYKGLQGIVPEVPKREFRRLVFER